MQFLVTMIDDRCDDDDWNWGWSMTMVMMTLKLVDHNNVGVEIDADDWWELTKRLVMDATEMIMLVVLGIGEKIMQFMMTEIRENPQVSTKNQMSKG